MQCTISFELMLLSLLKFRLSGHSCLSRQKSFLVFIALFRTYYCYEKSVDISLICHGLVYKYRQLKYQYILNECTSVFVRSNEHRASSQIYSCQRIYQCACKRLFIGGGGGRGSPKLYKLPFSSVAWPWEGTSGTVYAAIRTTRPI